MLHASRLYLLFDDFFLLITCFWIMYEYCEEKIDFLSHLNTRLSESDHVLDALICN